MKRVCLLLLLCVATCNDANHGSIAAPQPVAAFSTLGDLRLAIEAAKADNATDSDGDQIPDFIEELLGTNPNNPDTDGDGLVDNFELFGGEFATGLPSGGGAVLTQNTTPDNRPLPDLDRDGQIAPVDPDDNGDGTNDGETVDTDEDGIPNYLEFYGFTFDILTGRFEKWDGDPATPHFVTDPLQWSTDQDSFSDATETSGVMLDPTVQAPGNDPLVPAYPNLVFELASYSVTLNEDITISRGESLAKSSSWTRQTTFSHSYTSEFNWGVGVEAGASSGKPHVIVKGDIGGSYSSTNTRSTSVAIGKSITSAANWSMARSTNPTDAARIKLYLKVRNLGTAPISNMVPTLTLKIGGLNVATFEPGNSQVNMLVPGAAYPAEPGVYWTVDSVDTGVSVIPLSLTMAELRALERGAPVSVTATQILGDVMRLDSTGTWVRQGDTNEFVARCDAVSANIRIDLGQADDEHPARRRGQIIHQLIYAGDGPSAPKMTLGAALRKLGVEDTELYYTDDDGAPHIRSLAGFTAAIDSRTLRANGWDRNMDGAFVPPPNWAMVPADPGGLVIDLRPLRLFPYSTVYFKSPRGDAVTPKPAIHFAYFDAFNGEVMVSAADYAGIATVVVAAPDGEMLELTELVAGAGFYGGFVPKDFEGDLSVIVTNLEDPPLTSDPVTLGKLFVEEPPEKPAVDASLDAPNRYLEAEVTTANENPLSEIDTVLLFCPTFPPVPPVPLMPVGDSYKRPNHWFVTLDSSVSSTVGLTVVAITKGGLYTERVLTKADVSEAWSVGSGVNRAAATRDLIIYGFFVDKFKRRWDQPGIDLDGAAATAKKPFRYDTDEYLFAFSLPCWNTADDPTAPDFWFRVDKPYRDSDAFMLFNRPYRKITTEYGSFEAINRGNLENAIGLGSVQHPLKLGAGGAAGIVEGDILAVLTSGGRYAKVRIDLLPLVDGTFFSGRANVTPRVSWVTFKKDSDP